MRNPVARALLAAAVVFSCAGFVSAQPTGAARRSSGAAGAAPALSTQDYIDIQQLYARYALLIDTGDAEGWANTFTPDGVFNNSTRGHDALVQFVHDWRDKRNGVNMRHWYTNLVLTPAAGGATGSVYMFLLDVGKKPPAPSASYRYEDVLVKTTSGWRFKTRVLHPDTPAPVKP